LPEVSENIRVISVVGRFLEHSRIYYFHNGGIPEIYLGSADLMPRNINARVEVLFPLEDASLVRNLREAVLDNYLNDNIKARRMNPDGSYELPKREPTETPFEIQSHLLSQRARG
jgi:polyphosphate kinase